MRLPVKMVSPFQERPHLSGFTAVDASRNGRSERFARLIKILKRVRLHLIDSAPPFPNDGERRYSRFINEITHAHTNFALPVLSSANETFGLLAPSLGGACLANTRDGKFEREQISAEHHRHSGR